MELLGPDGLLSQVTKAVLERALAEGRIQKARSGHRARTLASRGCDQRP